MELVPFIDVVVVALFFVLLSSRFVLAPGISISLPTVENLPRDAAATSRVLTISESQGAQMILFEGRVFSSLDAFGRVLADRSDEFQSEILLIRADRDVSLELLARIWDLCGKAGFERVLLAAEPARLAPGAFP